MGGTNDPSNIVELTVEEHAEAHKKLWEEYGSMNDYCAWMGLSGRMGKEEIIRLVVGAAQKGRTHSLETKAKMSVAQKGRTHSPETKAKLSALNKGNQNWVGRTHSPETKAKLSAAAKGKTHSPEAKAKISAAIKGTMWITNGIVSRMIPKTTIIPEGFQKGRNIQKVNDFPSTNTVSTNN